MENIIWYAGIALMVYVFAKWWAPQVSTVDKEIDDILSREEYKVKGRFG